MKTIIDKNTGEVLYASLINVELAENEIAIEELPTGNYYDFKTKQFYENGK